MKKLLAALLVTSALLSSMAMAQDDVATILAQPSSGVELSQISRPEKSEPVAAAPKPAPAPVVVEKQVVVKQEVKKEPKKDAKKEAPKPVPAPIAVKPATQATEPAAEATATAVNQTNLMDILAKAYGTSPTLRAEREILRLQYEEVAQADALARPVIDVDAGISAIHAKDDPGSSDTRIGKDVGATLAQPIWAGGRISNYIDQQLNLSDAGVAAYEAATQRVFLTVITAAMDIVRDRAVITLNEKNRDVLTRQLSATENGFEVGELTRTDVSQARARVSEAEALLAAANAAYQGSLARFTQFAGMDGTNLSFARDNGLALPSDLLAAQSQAEATHPEIRYAQLLETAADNAISVAEGQLYPYVSLVGTADNDWDPLPTIDSTRAATLGVRATMNLYEGGASQSRIRQAKISRYEKQNRVEESQRSVRQQVATAWNNYQAAKTQIPAYEEQIEAATIARNGVYKEREVGLRTVLDTLDAERELLNAEVGLAQAQRDAVVADYALLAATGQLTPDKLGLFSSGDERSVMDSSRRHLIGTGVEARK